MIYPKLVQKRREIRKLFRRRVKFNELLVMLAHAIQTDLKGVIIEKKKKRR